MSLNDHDLVQSCDCEVIALLGDCHLTGNNGLVHGQNANKRLENTINAIKEDHPSLAGIIFLGDIATTGDISEYVLFDQLINDISDKVSIVIGNHDDRKLVGKRYGYTHGSESDYINYSVKYEYCTLVVIDSVVNNEAHGLVSVETLTWLDEELEQIQGRVVLALHHPPLRVCYRVDYCRLVNPDDLLGVLDKHQNKVELILFGHIHRNVSGIWHGYPFLTIRSTAYQGPFLRTPAGKLADHGIPNYGAIHLDATKLLVQIRDISCDRRP